MMLRNLDPGKQIKVEFCYPQDYKTDIVDVTNINRPVLQYNSVGFQEFYTWILQHAKVWDT